MAKPKNNVAIFAKQKNGDYMEKNLKKQLDNDLWIIVILSLLSLGVYIVFNSQIMSIAKDNTNPILLRVLLFAALQFGVAGFGITTVAIIRKENFCSYGLKKDNALISILLTALCYIPYLIFSFTTGAITSYLPFQQVITTNEVLGAAFPINVLGILITIFSWGFFEGFNYVVISDKINKLYPSRNHWVNWGAISCSILCILIHGMVGVTSDALIEMFTIIFFIYGMLIVKERTGNAWGSVFVFIFLWNAFK